jgi:hypothetical protein
MGTLTVTGEGRMGMGWDWIDEDQSKGDWTRLASTQLGQGTDTLLFPFLLADPHVLLVGDLGYVRDSVEGRS